MELNDCCSVDCNSDVVGEYHADLCCHLDWKPVSLSIFFRSLVCDGKRGLLTRLLQVMKKEPAESSFR